MKLWKVKDAYADLSALPMKGMAEEFPSRPRPSRSMLLT